mgnify:CR=1 FL=1
MEIEDLNKGIELCIQNAKRLLEDARVLFNNKRYEGSAFLGLTSMEEASKGLMLREYKRNGRELTKSQWKRKGFLSHSIKLAESMKRRGEYHDKEHPIIKGTYSKSSFVEWFAKEHTKLREYSLYVCRDFSSSRWKSPLTNTWLDKGWTEHILDGAKLTIKLAEEESTYT